MPAPRDRLRNLRRLNMSARRNKKQANARRKSEQVSRMKIRQQRTDSRLNREGNPDAAVAK
jgi:hypothetical protein